jgi:hypothetical protein
MTVILGSVYEAFPGKAAALSDVFAKGTGIAERLGAKVHRLQGYIGVPPTVLASVLEFDNHTALAEFSLSREEDPDWSNFIQIAGAAPVAQLNRSFDAIEVAGLESSKGLKNGAVHTTLLDPTPEKMTTLLTQLGELKKAHEKEGASVHIFRQTTGEDTGKLSYVVEFDNIIELGKFADKLERNMTYQDLMTKIYADPACKVDGSRSYRGIG